ncbi:hypothetical protein TNCV_3881021 [Trichonephila clavipes]|nr:hypothetical protein TNCV_3881021 [Trichonephila clavipes]
MRRKMHKKSDLIEELLAKLIDKEKQLENVGKDITVLTNIDDLEKEIEKQQECRDLIITCKVRANKILNKRETESRNTPITSSVTVTVIHLRGTLEKALLSTHQNKFNREQFVEVHKN